MVFYFAGWHGLSKWCRLFSDFFSGSLYHNHRSLSGDSTGSRCLTKHVQDSQLASIQISANNQEVIVTAFVDTGNHASDLLTGLPLIICDLQALCELFPDNVYRSLQTMSLDQIEHPYWKKHLRILPLSAVTGSSVVTGFKPDTCYLLEGNTKYPKEAIIALSSQPLSSGDFSALIGSALVLK